MTVGKCHGKKSNVLKVVFQVLRDITTRWDYLLSFSISLQIRGQSHLQIDEPLDNKTDNECLCSS